MDDKSIVDLYWQRSEKALSETAAKYGGYCYSIAWNVLANSEDAEESVNDTYLAAWEKIPPNRPRILSTFLGKITRNIAISRWRARTAAKRGGGEVVLALEELEECVPDRETAEAAYQRKEAARVLNRFLDALPRQERTVFLRRYWLLDPIRQIADSLGFTQSRVKTILRRSREALRDQLDKEGII